MKPSELAPLIQMEANYENMKVSRDHYKSAYEKLTTEGMLWRPIDEDAKWKHRYIIGLTYDNEVVKAHFAQDLSGEEQPAFSGFFIKIAEHTNREVKLKAYMPYPKVERMRVKCDCDFPFGRRCDKCDDRGHIILPEEKP